MKSIQQRFEEKSLEELRRIKKQLIKDTNNNLFPSHRFIERYQLINSIIISKVMKEGITI